MRSPRARDRLLGGLVMVPFLTSSAFAQPAPLPPSADREAPGPSDTPAATGQSERQMESEYRRIMSLGLEQYDNGRWAEARALFLHGHRLSPNARSLRVLGMTAYNLKRYPEALRELSAALEDPRRVLEGPMRSETQELLERVNVFVGRYRLRVEPASAVLRVDGLEVAREPDGSLLLPVGQHTLEVEAVDYVSISRPVVVDGTDGETLRFQLRPASLPGPVPAPASPQLALTNVPPVPLIAAPRAAEPRAADHSSTQAVFVDYRFTWLTAGGALGFGAAAIALHMRALRENDRLQEDCPGDCDPWEDVTAKRDRLDSWSKGTMGASIVLAAGAVVAYLLERPRARRRAP